MATQYSHLTVPAIDLGSCRLLAAIAVDHHRTDLFFASGFDVRALSVGAELEMTGCTKIASGARVTITGDIKDLSGLAYHGREISIPILTPKPTLLSRKNVCLAVRNGETVPVVLDWLRFHAAQHGMQAALILDRAPPGHEPGFAEALSKADIEGLDHLAVVNVNVPLGKPGLGPEAHRFYASSAPGKARMREPDADPWQAPIGDIQIFDALRAWILSEARAVANIEIHDLLISNQGPSIFDRARQSETGLVVLLGRQCYPWRLRKDQPASFADHTCIEFDNRALRRRWCVAPTKMPDSAVWRLTKVSGLAAAATPSAGFFRHMALRHPTENVSELVAKTALVEEPYLLAQSQTFWAHKPVRMPAEKLPARPAQNGRRAIVTCMKDEGPFILEWLAHHRAIGFDDILIYTNDCSDGTDRMLDLLDAKGLVQHRENPYRESPGIKPQHAALKAAEAEPIVQASSWVACIDVDEFINIKIGTGHLDDLFAAVPDANMIAMTWRLFGNGDISSYEDRFVTEQFTCAAPELCRKPHQAWGFKTLFENRGLFKKLGVHRPKGLKPQHWQEIRWVNGSGRPMPREMLRNAWRSTLGTYGYDLVQLNHYAVRSAESFLVKRARGRVNHTDRDQGLAYWFRMNNNAEPESSIARLAPMVQDEWQHLMTDPEIAAAHADCVAAHRAKIAVLRETPEMAAFFQEITSDRMQKLSRMHRVFGANVFLVGPEAVPDQLLKETLPEGAYFTVERRASET